MDDEDDQIMLKGFLRKVYFTLGFMYLITCVWTFSVTYSCYIPAGDVDVAPVDVTPSTEEEIPLSEDLEEEIIETEITENEETTNTEDEESATP